MRLTLKVVRGPDAVLPEPRRVSENELSIGRGTENGWVLPDPNRHLSKRHCTLAMRGGRWSVTDHSTNGTFVNRDIQAVGDGQTRNLRDGDRLRLGLYEIEVRIADEETLLGRDTSWITQAGIDTPHHDPFGQDPFGGAPREASVEDSSTGKRRLTAAEIPVGLDETLPADVGVDPVLARPLAPTQPPPHREAALSRPLETMAIAAGQAEPADLLAAFLRGAGVTGARPADPVATIEALGATFSALVVGLRQVMITRAKIKGEFRIEQTLMRAQGNNPLKFSADDQDALAALLGIGRRIDVKPADAVAGALNDIQAHETAAIAGMRAGMAAMLSRIDPARIAAAAEGAATLSPEGKARAWDLFTRQHAEIAASAPDDFEGIFGRAFARGYEQAIRDRS